ncbi:MAG: type II toxin-antitoxin system PemK/MazF family toxin [Candidatus Omnitrophica bacterium]|nr:type II toxin-antitoxin system PemK/MazF family toxin [Candidatus Omnitrophota bacterium]
MSIKRGNLFYVNLDPTKGSEQAGTRPVLVIQNDVGNEYAPTVIVAPLTTKAFTKRYPTNVNVPEGVSGLREDSTVLLSQIRTIDKGRLERKVGHLSAALMQQVDQAINVSLGLV